jgi:ATP-dependent RNA helicase DDX24/MAK5
LCKNVKDSDEEEEEPPRKRPLEESEEAEAPTKKKKKSKKSPAAKSGWSVSSVKDNTELDMSAWKNLFVPEPVIRALQEQGFSEPTKIQVN